MTLKEKIEKLREIFPEDERLRNAVLMAWGATEQLPAMNEAFQKTLADLPKPGESPLQWETVVHLNLAEVLRWVGNLEMGLHDLRQSLFFRYNSRVKKLAPLTEQEQAEALKIAESEYKREEGRTIAKKAIDEEKAEKKKEKAKAAADKPDPGQRIANLFDDLQGNRP